MDHDAITNIITKNRTVAYGVGITPNPFVRQQKEWMRRHDMFPVRKMLTEKIESLFEPRFITPPETSECIEAIISMTDSRRVLELGTCTGFGTLHMARALCGREGAKLVTIDARPAHDREFFTRPELRGWLEFVEGWTPQVLAHPRVTASIPYDLVFVDSDHSVDHCEKELKALWPITQRRTIFLFHDCPERQSPQHDPESKGVIWSWLHQKVHEGKLRGTCLPTCEQLDCLDAWGHGYPKECNPHLGIFVRVA